jgi:hypothetical protein
MPTWLLCVLLVLVLSVTGTRTLQKAICARQKERWHCGVSPETSSLLGIDSTSINYTKAQTSEPEVVPHADIPWRKLAALATLFAVIAGMRLLRGGQNFDSPVGIDSSSALYPVLVALPYVFLVGISYFSLKNLAATYKKQQSAGYELGAHEIKVRRSTTLRGGLSDLTLFLIPSFTVDTGLDPVLPDVLARGWSGVRHVRYRRRHHQRTATARGGHRSVSRFSYDRCNRVVLQWEYVVELALLGLRVCELTEFLFLNWQCRRSTTSSWGRWTSTSRSSCCPWGS